MKKLYEIVKERNEKQIELQQKIEDFKKEKYRLEFEIEKLLKLENIVQNGWDVEKVQIAETLIKIFGNPFGETSDVVKFNNNTIAECAIVDIANDCTQLKKQYFGNKKYDGFYQRCDCEYGYGPTHGSIVDEIGLINKEHLFTDEEKDACIYYIKNWTEIKKAKEIKK